MGKAVKPLSILLLDSTLEPYFAKLKEQGHRVDMADSGHELHWTEYDRIVGPQCYHLTPDMLANLPANTLPNIIKEARSTKYGK